MNSSLLTPRQIAEGLHVTERTVYRWLTQGKLRGMRVGRLWRIEPDELEVFLQRQGRGQAGPAGYRIPQPALGAGEVREGAPREAGSTTDLSDEDWAWLSAGGEDQARALAAAEADTPAEELAEFLTEVGRRATPIRWNPSRQAFEVVRP